jgi:hypothetical protein
VTCTSTCRKPNGRQAHCGACHHTWAGVTGFDEHRRGDRCLSPAEIGHTTDAHGVYRAPISESARARLASLRGNAHSARRIQPQGAETGPVVGRDTPGNSEAAETITCGHCLGPMRGHAAISDASGETWLCHPDQGLDCYRLVTLYGHPTPCATCGTRGSQGDFEGRGDATPALDAVTPADTAAIRAIADGPAGDGVTAGLEGDA